MKIDGRVIRINHNRSMNTIRVNIRIILSDHQEASKRFITKKYHLFTEDENTVAMKQGVGVTFAEITWKR